MGESAPEASAATAQTQLPEASPEGQATYRCGPEEDGVFDIAPSVERAARGRPYERRESREPIFRPLQIFTLDPSRPKREGSVATLRVPYEPLAAGPVGHIFEVDNFDGSQRNRRVDLDDPFILISSGLHPDAADPRFHQQMVYAVASSVYATFRTALGRHVAWGFDDPSGTRERLRLCPHGFRGENAFYDKSAGEVRFGFFKAPDRPFGRNLPKGWIFTCLSHDIVVHELTHALLDGLRSHFTLPTSREVLAFHEAFADLIAVLQRFSYEDVVRTALGEAQGNLRDAVVLKQIGSQFGETTRADGHALRDVDIRHPLEDRPLCLDEAKTPYELGSVLVSACFEAFTSVFRQKTKRYVLLATQGSGILPPGEISTALLDLLVREANRLAAQFLSIAIRAIDYCPPLDVTFGNFLRATITADRILVPDDRWSYREAIIDAFRVRRIFPERVENLSEESLLWRQPLRDIPTFKGLAFTEMKFRSDPTAASGPDELRRQACELGRNILSDERCDEFGVVRNGDPRLEGDRVDRPVVQSIRSARRVGPQGQIVFDLVAEVTQRRSVRAQGGERALDFYGGSTVVIDPEGKVRYIISKSTVNAERLQRQRAFLRTPESQPYWRVNGGRLVTKPQLFRALHEERPLRSSE